MITLFHLLQLVIPVLGMLIGIAIGDAWFGGQGTAIGGFLGFAAGIPLGKLPWRLSAQATLRELRTKSDDQLLAELREQRSFIPNLLLLELASRGHDIQQELPLILDLLEADEYHRRTRGWAAMLSAFPSSAAQMLNYCPAQPPDECRKIVCAFRRSLMGTPAEG